MCKENGFKEDAKFVEDHMGNQEKDKSRFVQFANEQEFTICRYFITWGIGTIVGILGFYMNKFNPVIPFLPLLRNSLILLGLSITAGILHYFLFKHRLLQKAEELDRSNRNYLARVMDKGLQEITCIKKEILKEYQDKSSIVHGSPIFLILQIVLFCAGIVIIGISLF